MRETIPMEPQNDIVNESIKLAGYWQEAANQLLTSEEKGIQEQMMRLLTHPMDKVILTKIIDQSFRSDNAARVADQVNSILREYGVPDFFSSVEKLLIQMFLGLGRHFPHLSVPRVIEKMRHNSSRAIIPGEPDSLHAHLQKRKNQGVRMNINHLGEAVLGEEEAGYRLKIYTEDLHNPEIEYISVKISTIYSQINSLAFEHSVKTLKERLSILYRAARDNRFVRKDGAVVPKFVNLDMEEYRDLEITTAAFIKTLEEAEFKNHTAGIVLQSYLPESFPIQKDLTAWALKRVSRGGSPIKIRIVKGANMEMELFDAAVHNWPLALYDNKLDVDANFKRMVDYGMEKERIKAVNLGIASHNLFELAYAFNLAKRNNLFEYFSFEMLEGMADHIRRAIQKTTGDILLYAPVATREQFINAIAYLIRRLDENTAKDNYLRYSCNLNTGSKEWSFLKFIASYNHRDKAGESPKRIQNRTSETIHEKQGSFFVDEFENEADTDWAIPANRKWAEDIRLKWKKGKDDKPYEIPAVVAGEEMFFGRRTKKCFDPSAPDICTAIFALASDEDAAKAVSTAKADPDGWRKKTLKERHEILSRTAVKLRLARGDLIGASAANTGKIFTEADPEISEAVDFAEYYPHSVKAFEAIGNIKCSGKGVGLVISPWNFPVAIPCGGIAASLAAGNTVIFKPSSEAVLPAWVLCRCFWEAGISKNVLQFLPCSGSGAGSMLANHPDVDFVILTGGTETGLNILKERPGLFLAAETGGKNATIVTAMSDRDQAIKNVLHSAFSNSGQKCSATSLLILEKEVYEDEIFRKQILDAAKSLMAGPAWNFRNKLGPLIHPPAGDLKRAIEKLEPGESWLLAPKKIDGNPHMWTPGIKWGVTPGSYTHMTEFFGPILGVICANDLADAIKIVNQTGYGLTSGLESLDKREQKIWKEGIKAGNLYINRGTTGAIVLRQPFGGMGKSAIGAGIKAGGPNYTAQFMNFKDISYPETGAIIADHALLRLAREWSLKLSWGELSRIKEDIYKTIRAIKSYLYNAEREFLTEKDYFHLRGQDNIVRYLPAGRVAVRLHEEDTLFDILARIAAAKIAGCDPVVSIPSEMNNMQTSFLAGTDGKAFLQNTPVVRQTDSELAGMIGNIQRIRYAAPERVPPVIFKEAAKRGFYISRAKVVMEGRIELLHYFLEQSICDNYHRYGNLGERSII
jgi:RHH-type transcriptional regulator, proline utilization regulon repressor / proline dehydrogenase / delta 1-pyrroline-5-carboxylate dehydrogenase